MNKPITAILVDDESNSRHVLRTLLERNFPEIDILGEAASAAEAFQLIQKVGPQLVFLDIQMPRADGFSLLKRFDEVPFEVVFVTSFDQYAMNAIRFSALDYLLKPVEVSDLGNAIRKAEKRISEKQGSHSQIINLLRTMDGTSGPQKVAVHVADAVKLIDERTIIYILADGSYCTILTDSGERFTTARYLKDFEDYFGQPGTFVRISKSVLINSGQIAKYSKGDPCMIEMTNGELFEVSRRKKVEVLAALKRKD